MSIPIGMHAIIHPARARIAHSAIPMEEQVQPQNTFAATGDHGAAVVMLQLPPGHDHHETYIVQFQKDQIYRVPPPQNATIMERYRNSRFVRNKERRRCCPCLLLTIALIVLAIFAIIAITLAVLYFIFTPTRPTFSITNFVVNNKNSPPHYQISLTAKNPNKRLGVEYQKDAEVFLLFERTRVATGKFPTLDQDPNDSNKVMVELSGSHGPLPRPMDKSMKDNKSSTPVALDLEMKLRVKVTAARLGTWVMKCNVGCTFVVSTLRNHTRVLSQECQTNFKQS